MLQKPSHFSVAIVSATILTALAFISIQLFQKTSPLQIDQVQAATILPTGQIGQNANWNLIFNDEFTGTTLDTTQWSNCIHWGILTPTNLNAGCWQNLANWEWYLPANTQVANGLLTIKTQKQTITNSKGTFNYTSGMITGDNTNGVPKKSFTYGLVEMRAKLPKGQGIWPAFWLLDAGSTGDYEIDAMELLGQEPAKMYMNYHWKNISGVMQQKQTDFTLTGTDFSADYHTFAIDWQPEAITWYVDGIVRKTFTQTEGTIYNQPMYILANTQVGGPTTWPGAPDATTIFPTDYLIDYIRVWQKGSTPTVTPTPVPAINLLNNPSFESTTGAGLEPWSLDVKTGAKATLSKDTTTATNGNASAVINITKKSTTDWYVQLNQHNLPLIQGKTYAIQFMAKATTPYPIAVVMQQNNSPYTEFFRQTAALTSNWQLYNFTFTAPVTEADAKLSFSLATQIGKVWFDQLVVTQQ